MNSQSTANISANDISENEKHVAEDQGKIDGLKEELRDKTARVNELEVNHSLYSVFALTF